MEQTTQADARTLSEQYFRGEITNDEAQKLVEFLKASPENLQLFRQWEDLWVIQGHTLPTATDDEGPSALLWKVLASAAMLLLVLAVGLHFYLKPAEKTFVCQAPSGSQAEINLPDGTHVILNADTRLSYTSAYGQKNRAVSLNGEAYFNVVKDQNHPFIVNTEYCQATVHGTRFNISSYVDDSFVRTELYQGSLEVAMPDTTVMLRPSQAAVYDKELACTHINKGTRDSADWASHNISYNDITVGQLAKLLSRQSGLKVHIADQHIAEIHITAQIKNQESIDEITTALTRILPIRVTRRGQDIYISDK